MSHDLRGAQALAEGRDKGQCSVWIVGSKLEQHEPPVGGKQAGHPGLWRGTADQTHSEHPQSLLHSLGVWRDLVVVTRH